MRRPLAGGLLAAAVASAACGAASPGGSDGDATDQLPDAERLALRGIASLTVTPPQTLFRCSATADVRSYSNYVVGRRRALDLIQQLQGADATRVAAVGSPKELRWYEAAHQLNAQARTERDQWLVELLRP